MRILFSNPPWFTTVRKNGERINPDPQWPDVVDFLAALK